MSVVNKTTLIVNYLPQTLTDEEFRDMFAAIAPLLSWKVVRDRNTGYSYGFGFVEYAEEHQATQAIEKLNGTKLQNKTIKVSFSRQGDVKGANLFIANIPKSFTADDLKDLFTDHGKVVQSHILTDSSTGESKGTGFILFDTKDEAVAAMSALHGKPIPGSSGGLIVRFAEGKSKTQANATKDAAGSSTAGMPTPYGMFGGAMNPFGGDYGTMAAAAAAYFMQCAGFCNEGMYGMNRGMMGPGMMGPGMMGPGMMGGAGMGGGGGLMGAPGVRMGGPGMMRGADGGGAMRTRMARGGARFNPLSAGAASGAGAAKGAQGGNILFAYNIGTATGENELRALFSMYGSVSKVDIMWDHTKNQGKGYGFVTMPNYDEAEFAVAQLNGYNFAGKPLQVSFKSKKE